MHAALGVIATTGSLIIYGVMQERIMTIGWGADQEVFKHSVFLVLCNRIITSLITFSYMVYAGSRVIPAAPLSSYGLISVTNVVATSCQYEALKYVSFAVQTLAKSAKTLPVMLWGTVFIGKRYKVLEYLQALSITAGCTIFLLTGDIQSRVAHSTGAGGYALVFGASLMMLYLAVDGLTSTWQDKLFKTYSMEITDQIMYTTGFSAMFSFIAVIASNQLLPSLEFLVRHPEAMFWFLGLSVASCVVQLCISSTIKQYGALVFATIMTTRQFFSILLSSVLFAKPFSGGQWVAIAVVFTALYLQVFTRPGKKHAKQHEPLTPHQLLPLQQPHLQSPALSPFSAQSNHHAAPALRLDHASQVSKRYSSAAAADDDICVVLSEPPVKAVKVDAVVVSSPGLARSQLGSRLSWQLNGEVGLAGHGATGAARLSNPAAAGVPVTQDYTG